MLEEKYKLDEKDKLSKNKKQKKMKKFPWLNDCVGGGWQRKNELWLMKYKPVAFR